MRHLLTKVFPVLLIGFWIMAVPASGQQAMKSRSGVQSGNTPLAVAAFPCTGDSILKERFENGIPTGWMVLDLDTLNPTSGTMLNPGWQSRVDYRDSMNQVVVSPSFYQPSGTSEDWLISPQVTLGNNSCFSWLAYSQDQYFLESYEVRISTGTADTASFFAQPALLSVAEENFDPTYRSLNLSAYAGQTVYLAFRHTSNDKFVLALDDFSLSEVEMLDEGVLSISPLNINKGDTVKFTGELLNYGSDTVQSVSLSYQIDGGSIETILLDSLSHRPNFSLDFSHDSLWITDTLDAFFTMCAWTSQPNGGTDQDPLNDTLCVQLRVGSPIGILKPTELGWDIGLGPNPVKRYFRLNLEAVPAGQALDIRVLSPSGKVLERRSHRVSGGEQLGFSLAGRPAGLYFIQVLTQDGHSWTGKILKQE